MNVKISDMHFYFEACILDTFMGVSSSRNMSKGIHRGAVNE